MKPRATLSDDLVNRLAVFNATYELMKQQDRLDLIYGLATELVETLPLRARIRIKVKIFFVRWRLRFVAFVKGEQ